MNFSEDSSFIDIWSIPHFLSGFLIGLPCLWLGFGFASGLLTVLGTGLLFEVVEIYFHVNETIYNKISDFVLCTIAFIFIYYLFTSYSHMLSLLVFVVSVLIYLPIVISGWLRYLSRKHNVYEQKSESN